MEWLETLGEVRTNWRKKEMSFKQGDSIVSLKGHQTEGTQPALALQEIIHEEEEIREGSPKEQQQLEPFQNEQLEALLQMYPEVFQELTELPPRRTHDHAITLKPGTEPVNVRPYKYAYHHKDEIEKQVNELLQAGVIRQSTSPFSSHVILVKKKDGSWRMCVDYRALTKLLYLISSLSQPLGSY